MPSFSFRATFELPFFTRKLEPTVDPTMSLMNLLAVSLTSCRSIILNYSTCLNSKPSK